MSDELQQTEQAPEPKKKSGWVKKTAKTALLPPVADFSDVGGVSKSVIGMVKSARRQGRVERFHDALARQGLSVEEADERAVQIRRMGRIYVGSAVVALLLVMHSPFSSVPLAQFLSALGVMAFTATRGAIAYFRVAQIRDRELYGFMDWVRGHAGDDGDGDVAPPVQELSLVDLDQDQEQDSAPERES